MPKKLIEKVEKRIAYQFHRATNLTQAAYEDSLKMIAGQVLSDIAKEIKNMKLPKITPREYPNVQQAIAACKVQQDVLKAVLDLLSGENT